MMVKEYSNFNYFHFLVMIHLLSNGGKDGYLEIENEILKSYKVLSSFKYLEELISNINIPEEVQHEIPE